MPWRTSLVCVWSIVHYIDSRSWVCTVLEEHESGWGRSSCLHAAWHWRLDFPYGRKERRRMGRVTRGCKEVSQQYSTAMLLMNNSSTVPCGCAGQRCGLPLPTPLLPATASAAVLGSAGCGSAAPRCQGRSSRGFVSVPGKRQEVCHGTVGHRLFTLLLLKCSKELKTEGCCLWMLMTRFGFAWRFVLFVLEQPLPLVPFVTYNKKHSIVSDLMKMGFFRCVSSITKASKTVQMKQLSYFLELISELSRCTSSTNNQLHLCL